MFHIGDHSVVTNISNSEFLIFGQTIEENTTTKSSYMAQNFNASVRTATTRSPMGNELCKHHNIYYS